MCNVSSEITTLEFSLNIFNAVLHNLSPLLLLKDLLMFYMYCMLCSFYQVSYLYKWMTSNALLLSLIKIFCVVLCKYVFAS